MWANPQETVNLVTFTEEILNGKFYFCAEGCYYSKLQITNHPGLIFNHNTVSLTKSQKHPRVVLDSILDFRSIWK